MKFDELNVEQLEARLAELSDETSEEKRDALDNDALEARIGEMEAIKGELESRRAAAAEEARKAEEAAKMDGEKIIEVKKMKKLQGKELNAEERQAVTATAANPTITMNEIVHKLELNPLIAAVDVTNIPGYVTYPAEGTINDAAWVAMGTAATDSADTLTAVTLGAYKLIKTVEITADVEAMSVDAFESWLVARLANKIEKAIDAGILNGGGSTSGECLGIKTSKSRPWPGPT